MKQRAEIHPKHAFMRKEFPVGGFVEVYFQSFVPVNFWPVADAGSRRSAIPLKAPPDRMILRKADEFSWLVAPSRSW
ncbi:MAG: hypothetical protein HZB44_00480 [Actinobacteria bacterium]|nr:hypothetical protein [Actinomycetota bacterium]